MIMLRDVDIVKTGNPEEGYSDKEELFNDVLQHKKDVSECMDMLSEHIHEIGENHDWTKVEFFDEFANDTLERLDTPDFKERDWYNIHCNFERHHINAFVPDDVDFFDLLEFISDCLIAGKTRSGDVNYDVFNIDENIILKSYFNTVAKIDNHLKLL